MFEMTNPTFTMLVDFNTTDGAEPSGGLIANGAGDLFGTTQNGGTYSVAGGYGTEYTAGTVFEIAKTSTGYASTPTTLVSFDVTDGSNPYGAGLGPVDKPRPDADASEQDESHEAGGELVISGGDAPLLLEMANEALNP
jgi:hypothetical protein